MSGHIYITREQLNNGFAGLSLLTRQMVLEELRAAQLDTSVEYHRAWDKSIQQSLWNEIQGLNALIESCEQVEKEFKEVGG